MHTHAHTNTHTLELALLIASSQQLLQEVWSIDYYESVVVTKYTTVDITLIEQSANTVWHKTFADFYRSKFYSIHYVYTL